MFIQTENTPNPNAIKFLPGTEVSPSSPVYFNKSNLPAVNSNLAKKLLYIDGVETVFFGEDFITISKSSESDWLLIKPEVLMVIMDHFVADLPIFEEQLKSTEVNYDHLPEIEKQILEIIDTRVRPSVAMDGGDIIYRGFKDGIVLLELQGSCQGCPSSSITLKNGIESMLKHFVPEVIAVEAIDPE